MLIQKILAFEWPALQLLSDFALVLNLKITLISIMKIANYN